MYILLCSRYYTYVSSNNLTLEEAGCRKGFVEVLQGPSKRSPVGLSACDEFTAMYLGTRLTRQSGAMCVWGRRLFKSTPFPLLLASFLV